MNNPYTPVNPDRLFGCDRRRFLQTFCCTAAGGLMLGAPPLYGQDDKKEKKPEKPAIKTNIGDYMKVPRARCAIPGLFPGKVVKVTDPDSYKDEAFDKDVIEKMVHKGIRKLTGKTMKESFGLLFNEKDVVGIKVNPVGAPLINTRHEVTQAVIKWLTDCGLPKENIVIWDRFNESLEEAGYTAKNYPGIQIHGLNRYSVKLKEDGTHPDEPNFDKEAFYYAEGVEGKTGKETMDLQYLSQHVFNGQHSYFGKLLTRKITKIINIPGYKNTGNGVSMALKNLAYAAICNTGRLHRPLFFRVCTEVMAAPWIRDKLVLNILDGIRGQYDGGPGKNAQFVYSNHSLYFATDPIALDVTGHNELLAKRKEMKVKVSEHPRYFSYFNDCEKLGLGMANKDKIEVIKV